MATALPQGGGRFDLGIVGAPGLVGIGASLEHRLLAPDLSLFGEFDATTGDAFRTFDWQATAGLRLRW